MTDLLSSLTALEEVYIQLEALRSQPVSRGRGGLEYNVGTCTHWNRG
jgi:hypothetical protein